MSKIETSGENISDTPLSDALSERYLAYAMSTIASRSLPDVRDGLKPVHRRLLYAMRILKLDPAYGFKKCARVVGDVIGKYHPHGDTAVYDAMVRLAQEFAVRYPLVEGHGNFGNIDGDNAAAMRYTEARLTEVATSLMNGLDENAVDFRPTYDGEDEEPVVMPAAFPNLLANGSTGIAVGMATNIAPHNLGEICDGLLHLIKNPDAEIEELIKYIPAPDFPTGGVLVESKETILNTYKTGRGSFRLRTRWEKETLAHGLYQIVITEIPYQIQKSKLIERVADMIFEKKLPFLSDIRDESSENIRIVLEPKNRTIDAEHLMEHLFRLTDLEIKFNLNMNVINAIGIPEVMGLKKVLVSFLEHRGEVLERRSRYRLEKIIHRLEVLEGYLIVYLNLDEIIRIIRNEDKPRPVLMEFFKLTEVQAEAILNMRLRSLRKLEEDELRIEHKKLSDEKLSLEELLASSELCLEVIAKEILEIKNKFGKKTKLGKRRTEIRGAVAAIDMPIEAMVEREPITVLLSEKGWIRAMKGHVDLNDIFKFKDGDSLKFALHAQTTDKILLMGTSGRFFTIAADKLPRGRGYGEPLRLMVDLPNDAEFVHMLVHKKGRLLLVASAKGRGFIVEENEIVAQTRSGKKVLNVVEGDSARFCITVEGDGVAIIGLNRKLLVFKLDEIPLMSRGRGVILQKYKDGGLSDIKTFNLEGGLSWQSGRGISVEKNLMAWLGKRAQVGRLPPVGFPRSNKFS